MSRTNFRTLLVLALLAAACSQRDTKPPPSTSASTAATATSSPSDTVASRHDPASCNPRRMVKTDSLRAELTVPDGESCATGNYRVVITYPGGKTSVLSGRRDGTIEGVWLVDLDRNGKLDVIVPMASTASGSQGNVSIFRQTADGFFKVPVAGLDPDLRTMYGGHDRFEITADGRLVRAFTVVGTAPPVEIRAEYSLAENKWKR